MQEHEQRVKDLEEKVNSIPVIEAELTQLNRDYDVIRGQHSTLLQRRESARISEDVEQSAGDVVFRVIDPPFVPQTPDEPNKLLLNSGVLVIAIGGALAIGLLMSLLQPGGRGPALAGRTGRLAGARCGHADPQRRNNARPSSTG
ncbi:MAG: hypothetical protein IPO20_19360 [Gammaproteobacteria bacterium]|nr:hypothetical protein [Gammaproteobacteria bacterium]